MANIVVSEDDAHMLRILSMWLSRNGHEVLEARNGLEAKEIIGRQEVDLIVSDVNMPHVDGLQLVQWVRQEQQNNVPMILLSSRCDQEDIAKRLQSMGVRVHPKPFSPSKLVQEIESMLHQPIGT